MEELTLAVVGIDFVNTDKARTNRRSELLMSEPGDPVDLRPEPRNPHDANAVAVFSARGIQVGYLSAKRAPWIGRRLKAGEEVAAVFQGISGAAAYIRIRFGGGAPTLPPAPPHRTRPPVGTASPDSESFHPDPEGPDWGA